MTELGERAAVPEQVDDLVARRVRPLEQHGAGVAAEPARELGALFDRRGACPGERLRFRQVGRRDRRERHQAGPNYLDRVREGQPPPARAITDREEEILKLVAEGHTSQDIADLLVISVKTVERHRANLLQKLGLKDRLELTRYAIRVGLIEP